MLKVGITGGIGSGKTTVCRIFETLGIPVYYADERAKWLMMNDKQTVDAIKVLFGEKAYAENQLNRSFIASIVFKDKNMLTKLNNIVHPAVAKDSIQWHNQQEAAYTIKEAALLFESGSYKELDKIITVFAPVEIRVNRVIQRDQTTREAVENRINNQMNDQEKIRLADFVIHNYENRSLIKQVIRIDKILRTH